MADITIPGSGGEYEATSVQKEAALNTPGGRLVNTGEVDIFVHVNAGTVGTSQPLGAGVKPLYVGGTLNLPRGCRGFTYKTEGSNGYFYWEQ